MDKKDMEGTALFTPGDLVMVKPECMGEYCRDGEYGLLDEFSIGIVKKLDGDKIYVAFPELYVTYDKANSGDCYYYYWNELLHVGGKEK